MKVDFPQPESAATPIIMGVCPGAKAIWRLLEEEGPAMFFGMKAEGAKAATVPMVAKERTNFIFYLFKKL
jgi:hypothetical protein